MPKASRRWPKSPRRTSPFGSGRPGCAHCVSPKKPPTAQSRSRRLVQAERSRPDMTKDERHRAEARFHKAAKAAEDLKSGKSTRDAAARAVLDNMARLKALRLAK